MSVKTQSPFIEGEIVFEGKTLEQGPAAGIVRMALGDAARQALTERIQREAMRMIPSLASEMAKNAWQGELEVHRIAQAERVGSETLVTATKAIVRNNCYAERLMREHPSVAIDIAEMVSTQNDLMKQLPKIATTAYLHRYYNK